MNGYGLRFEFRGMLMFKEDIERTTWSGSVFLFSSIDTVHKVMVFDDVMSANLKKFSGKEVVITGVLEQQRKAAGNFVMDNLSMKPEKVELLKPGKS